MENNQLIPLKKVFELEPVEMRKQLIFREQLLPVYEGRDDVIMVLHHEIGQIRTNLNNKVFSRKKSHYWVIPSLWPDLMKKI